MSKSLVLLFTLAAAGAAWAEEVRLTELLRRPAIADVIFDSESGAIHSFARDAPELVRYPAMRASALLGREVRDRLHRDAGEIVDLVIDLEAKRVARAIIDLRDDWKPGRRVVAVPIETFSLPQDLGDYAVLNIERERLDQ